MKALPDPQELGGNNQAERIQIARRALGMTQREFAEKIGVSLSTYTKYENDPNATIKSDQLVKIIETGIDISWLLTGLPGFSVPFGRSYDFEQGKPGPLPPEMATAISGNATPRNLDDFVLVPRYDIEASAGAGALADEEHILDYMAFQERWVRSALKADPNKLALITASGDSMEPAIRSGDLLLIDKSVDRVIDDSIYVVSIEDFLLVKRVQKLLQGIVVKSDSPHYAPMTLSSTEAKLLQIRGRVRWIGRLI